MSEKITVGGQAVLEGVMMRSPTGVATAVRQPDGQIIIQEKSYVSWSTRIKLFSFPILRGFVNLIETLIIGMSTLSYSADVLMTYEEQQEKEEKEEKETSSDSTHHTSENWSGKAKKTSDEKKSNFRKNMALASSILVSIGLGLILFAVIPYTLTELFQKRLSISSDSFSFNVIAGFLRMSIFLLYLYLISRMRDIQRVFEYHGAEHKSIAAFEAGLPLNVDNARPQTRFHPRCGTSFLLIVVISALFVYVIFDSWLTVYLGHRPSLWLRLGTHLLLLPFIGGVSYELIRLSGKVDQHHWLARILLAPGLMLQRLTTSEPSDDQLEVALASLKASLAVQPSQQNSELAVEA